MTDLISEPLMKLFPILLALFLLLVSSFCIYGSCPTQLTPEQAFEVANFVFIGKMNGGTEKTLGTNKEGSQLELEAGDVKFEIESSLKTFKGTHN